MKKFFLIGFIVILLVSIPAAIYIVRQNTRGTGVKAAPSTILTASTTPTTVAVGATVPVDIVADPGSNAVSVVKLNISYDSTKLSTASGGFAPNATAFPTILDPVTYGPCTGNYCTITATLAIGADPTKAITTKTTVGTITFKTLATTDQGPTNVTFGNQTTVYSVAQADQASENVLSSTTPLALTISSSANLTGSITPTATTTATPTPSTATGTTPTPTSATSQAPLCTSLSVDSNTATPGGSINFTANGNSPGATVSKVTFNFGDGNTMDVTTGGGLGTNNVSLQQAHLYATEGAYTATAVMTDVNNLVSNSLTCSQVITIGSGSSVIATNPTSGSTSTTTTSTSIPKTLPSTGPGDTFITAGIIGGILTVVGGLLFFIL